MVFAPPTAQLGAAGWAAGIGIQALSLAGWTAMRRRPQAITFGALLVVTWLLPLDLAAMQWLGGGWSAPYHELLPARAHPRLRRAADAALRPPSGLAVALLALLPALYAPEFRRG